MNNSFIAEIRKTELMSKILCKYIASFDYFDKALIVLSKTNGSISIVSFATVIGAFVGIAMVSFCFAFSINTGFVKKILKQHKIKRKSIIKFLC